MILLSPNIVAIQFHQEYIIVFSFVYLTKFLNISIYDNKSFLKQARLSNDPDPAIGGASQHNSMPVPSPGKWGGKPENPA